MRIYPAIDLKDGKCVRLSQGKFELETVFSENPVEVALKWAKAGAGFIHVVDLDGARFGNARNNEIIEQIVRESGILVQTGGGIRSMRDIEDKINIGVSRLILGTSAIKDPAFVREAVKNYGNKIAVGIDAVNSMVATHGWEEVSNVSAMELCYKMQEMDVKTIIYTDISKDGMMQGPNVASTKEIVDAVKMDVIASGGVSSEQDLERLAAIGVSGVIVGKALYSGDLDLRKIINLYS